MEIVNANVASLCNYEVQTHLQNIKESRNKFGQLATITYETLKYLDNSPCAKQSEEDVNSCMKALEPFNLNKNEKLMIINNPPTTPLEMQLIIEESEERLTEEQVEKILKIASEHLHVNRIVQDDVEEEGEDENNE